MYNEESESILEKLKEEQDFLIGTINVSLGDISFTLINKDLIGSVIESWFNKWVILNNIVVKKNMDSQAFPDYYVGQENDFLELKCFDADRRPSFDIADFENYYEIVNEYSELSLKYLDCDYLIFGYTMTSTGEIIISDIFLKKIWEITCPSKKFPLRVQSKRGKIYAIRPTVWYSKSSRIEFPVFKSKYEFFEALNRTYEIYKNENYW
jgi:hypothetical protein